MLRRLVGVLVASLALLCVSGAPARAQYPTADPFYAPPADLASLPNGAVIRSRAVQLRGSRYNLPFRSHQVLYRTTDRTGAPIATVASILHPKRRAAGPPRLISYQTAYDGLSPECRPSYSLRTGRVLLQATEAITLALLLERGWTVVTADYEGPNDDWGVATTSARGVLDGVRAAERFAPAGLDGERTQVGLMGYSGGGNATAWANEEAAAYAPELRIAGSVQGGVAPDLAHLVRTFDGTLYAGVAFAGLAGISRAYPELDVDRHLNGTGQRVFKTLRQRQWSCIENFVLRWPGARIDALTREPGLMDRPEVQAVAAQQGLGRTVPTTPTMWLATTVDEMKNYGLVRAMAGRYCRAGVPQRFISTDRVEHILMFSWMQFLGADWLAERFAGKPPRSDCAKIG
ncbi:MAG: hypothetical protein PGN13_10040 [Patulibacter minatonensis]